MSLAGTKFTTLTRISNTNPANWDAWDASNYYYRLTYNNGVLTVYQSNATGSQGVTQALSACTVIGTYSLGIGSDNTCMEDDVLSITGTYPPDDTNNIPAQQMPPLSNGDI